MPSATVLNACDEAEARNALSNCCAARRWIDGMLARRPFKDDHAMLDAAAQVAAMLNEPDWLEAFAAHPLIGDVDTLREEYAATRSLAASEQSGVSAATDATLRELAVLNRMYRERFGFIFIVFAKGKTAEQMLASLQARITNSRDEELQLAAAEQLKITQLRLRSLAAGAGDP